MQYLGELSTIAPHGNSKKFRDEPYVKLKPKIFKQIKELPDTMGAIVGYHKMLSENSDDGPRNPQQIRKFRSIHRKNNSKIKTNDSLPTEIRECLFLMNQGDQKFVQKLVG